MKHIASKCHPNRPEFVVGSGICKICRSKELLSKRPPSRCHPDRPEYVKGSGICEPCHQIERCKRHAPSKCHPDSPELVIGSGVCKSCHAKSYKRGRPPATCHPDRPMVNKKTGLCNACSVLKFNHGIVIDYPKHTCEICGQRLQSGTGKSAIDHDHITGALRGVLCSACNKMIGFAKDDPAVLSKAIEYLQRYSDAVPEKVS